MKATYTERNILNSEFGDNRWVNGYFKLGERQTRRFAIVLHISTIGLHGPFGYVISRSADNSAPIDELQLDDLVGARDATLFGTYRYNEPDQQISASVYFSSASAKPLGEFDVPPLAEFTLKELREVLVCEETREKRFAQFLFCAPSGVWPRASGSPLFLDGDGSFVSEDQRHVIPTGGERIKVTVEPWARYGRSNHDDLGPELFRRMYASPKVLGEQSTRLILNAPQAALLIEPIQPDVSDKEFVDFCNSIAETLRIGFSFLVGTRCYWHTRYLQTGSQHEALHIDSGFWADHVPFGRQDFPVGRLKEIHFTYEDFFKHLIDFGSSNKPRDRLASYVESYVACMVPTNSRDCLMLFCLLLEELSRNCSEWLIPKDQWRRFVEEAAERFPEVVGNDRVRSSLSHIAHSKFAQRLSKWASDHKIEFNDLGKEPFGEIVKVRNKIVHSTDQPASDDEISLQLARAITLLDRFILKQMGWNEKKPIREFAIREVHYATSPRGSGA